MKTTELPALVIEAHSNALKKGFWINKPTFGDSIALIHSELSEALEDFRDGKEINKLEYKYGKPVGIPSELADVIIRVCDLAGRYDIDIETAVLAKMIYNRTRPFMHGKIL